MVIAAGDQLLNSNKLLQEVLAIGAGARVADFGCGATAINTLTAAKLVGVRGEIYAVDILKNVLSSVVSHAQHEGLVNVKTIWADLEQPNSTKILTESLDFVLMVNILFQIKEPKIILQEAKRILKPGGKILVVEWQARNEGIGPESARRLSEDKAKQLLDEVGLRMVSSFVPGPHHYGLVVEK